MTNKYIPTIGLEIHIVLNTKTKMFSPAYSSHTDGINNHINEIDLALPGSLPALNENAVKKAIRLAHALHMQINYNPITFDRKNYFYWDLPKNFQITQQFNPIGVNGYVILDDEQHTKITIERIQMEEDTAKQIKVENSSDLMLNYNRAGMPLIEIVSNPVLHSAKEVSLYLTALKEICLFMDVSDAKMEEGSMRVDVNVSLAESNANQFGTKVEVKNINSINNAVTALEYEIARQTKLLENHEPVIQETRRFDDVSNTTVFMRQKGNSIDYRYMTEPNILAIHTPQSFVDEVLNNLPPHPFQIRNELKQHDIAKKDIDILLSDKAAYSLFNQIYHLTNDYKDAIRWVLNELAGVLNEQKREFKNLTANEKDSLILLIQDFKANKFNSKQAKDLFLKIYVQHLDYHNELKKLQSQHVSYSDEQIAQMIGEILKQNPKTKEELTTRYERAEKFIMGSLMKQSKGQINPVQAKAVLDKIK